MIRPLSLLCVLSKVLERCVFNRLVDHLTEYQHGFPRGRSTVTQMLCFLHKIGEALDMQFLSDRRYLSRPV